MAERSTRAGPTADGTAARPPGGRHLVLVRHGCARAAVDTMRRSAGLRLGVASDFGQGTAGSGLAHGEGILFERLGAALLRSDADQLSALAACRSSHVGWIEPERIVHASAATHGAAAGGPDATWGLQATRTAQSRFSGRGIRLAVLDTGLDLMHPDFSTRDITARSFVAGSPIDDRNGHGTHAAGVAAGPRLPSQGPRYGAACDAALCVAKIVDDDGSGADGNVLAGLDWALGVGCAVVSLSVGSPVAPEDSHSVIFEQLAQRALAAGMLIIASAGNDSLRPGSIAPVNHPANCPSIVAVAAVDEQMRVWSESCGGITRGGGKVDIAAPGVAIPSAWPRPWLYQLESGTSAATPYVAGIAALLAEASPEARGAMLRRRLLDAARPLDLPQRDVGAGLAQAP